MCWRPYVLWKARARARFNGAEGNWGRKNPPPLGGGLPSPRHQPLATQSTPRQIEDPTLALVTSNAECEHFNGGNPEHQHCERYRIVYDQLELRGKALSEAWRPAHQVSFKGARAEALLVEVRPCAHIKTYEDVDAARPRSLEIPRRSSW